MSLHPWQWPWGIEPEKPAGTRVWRLYFKDKASFTHGYPAWYERAQVEEAARACEEGELIDVEPVT